MTTTFVPIRSLYSVNYSVRRLVTRHECCNLFKNNSIWKTMVRRNEDDSSECDVDKTYLYS